MKVSEMMRKRVVTAGADEDAEDAWRRMLRNRIRHLVVLQDGKIVGIVSDRDMAGARGPGIREGNTVRQLMTPGVLAATPDMSLPEAAGLMRSHHVSCLPVVNDRKLRGILTTSDVLDYVIGGGQRGARKAGRRASS